VPVPVSHLSETWARAHGSDTCPACRHNCRGGIVSHPNCTVYQPTAGERCGSATMLSAHYQGVSPLANM
jgi:hypothetical protein